MHGKHSVRNLQSTHQVHHVPVLPAPILQLIHKVRHKGVAVDGQEVVLALLESADSPLHVHSHHQPPLHSVMWYNTNIMFIGMSVIDATGISPELVALLFEKVHHKQRTQRTDCSRALQRPTAHYWQSALLQITLGSEGPH